jgi:dienelactone hydrolase
MPLSPSLLTTRFFLLSTLAAAPLLAAAALPPSAFDYDSSRPLDIQVKATEQRDGVEVRDITFASAAGGRTAAYLVVSPGSRPAAGILFAHWYEPTSADSNRTQFVSQAVELAKAGATSLLIETLWSEPSWFANRNPAEDFNSTVTQVKELRRALDVLLAQPHIDRKRVAFVGHDLGMMCGAVMAGVDRRVNAWALQAGTTSFSLWYLYTPHLEGAARQAKIDELAPLDPVLYIPKAAPAPVLMQFGHSDRHVPDDKAQAFFEAAREPKQILWYDAGHHLDDRAIADRQKWLRKVLKLER